MSMSRITLLVVGLNTVLVLGGTVFNYLQYTAASPLAGSISFREEKNQPKEITEYTFYPIEKIIVNLQNAGREYYFVLDLALQTDISTDIGKLQQFEPLLRNSVIGSLSMLTFNELRSLSITQVQSRLESALRLDFASKGIVLPFTGVLVSKLLVQ